MCLLQSLGTYEDYYAIVSYFKGCIPYEGEYIVYCVSPNKNTYLPKKVCALWKIISIKLMENFKGFIYYNTCNFVGVCLLKSSSVVDIFLRKAPL